MSHSAPVIVSVGLIAHGERDSEPTYIATLRRKGDHLGGSWELPGGKLERGESAEDALRREILEELGAHLEDVRPLTFSHFRYPEREVLLLFFSARTAAGAVPAPLMSDQLALLTARELLELPMPPANEPLRDILKFKQSRSA
jgi:8-oxo-dGTP diphosphatase